MKQALQRRPRSQSAPAHNEPSNSTTARYSLLKGVPGKAGACSPFGIRLCCRATGIFTEGRFVERLQHSESCIATSCLCRRAGNVLHLLARGSARLWKHVSPRESCGSSAWCWLTPPESAPSPCHAFLNPQRSSGELKPVPLPTKTRRCNASVWIHSTCSPSQRPASGATP